VSWLQILQTVWPIASAITPVIMLGGFAWLQTKFPSQADLKEHKVDLLALNDRVSTVMTRMTTSESRIENILRDLEREPTRADLSSSIADLRERMGRVESSVDSVRDQLETQNEYLHTLIQQGMNKK
jgi:GTP1/Obg family GTP-binding protein